jgi:hypothetical protein
LLRFIPALLGAHLGIVEMRAARGGGQDEEAKGQARRAMKKTCAYHPDAMPALAAARNRRHEL